MTKRTGTVYTTYDDFTGKGKITYQRKTLMTSQGLDGFIALQAAAKEYARIWGVKYKNNGIVRFF